MNIIAYIFLMVQLNWFLPSVTANVCSQYQLDCPRWYGKRDEILKDLTHLKTKDNHLFINNLMSYMQHENEADINNDDNNGAVNVKTLSYGDNTASYDDVTQLQSTNQLLPQQQQLVTKQRQELPRQQQELPQQLLFGTEQQQEISQQQQRELPKLRQLLPGQQKPLPEQQQPWKQSLQQQKHKFNGLNTFKTINHPYWNFLKQNTAVAKYNMRVKQNKFF